MDETSQRLSTIRDHLTKALSSSDSQLHFSKALDGLSAAEDGTHKAIAAGFITKLLRYFLNSTNSVPSRYRAGIIIARLCRKSAEIVETLPRIPRGDRRFLLVYGLGNLILEEGVHEDLRLICGLVIRSCVLHGVDHRIFWPAHEPHAPFPVDDGKQWAHLFYNFVRADDGLRAVRIVATKGTTLSPGKADLITAALREIEEGRSTGRIHTPRRISTTEAFNVSVLSSPPKQLTAIMAGATEKLAKMRDKRRSEWKSAEGMSATVLVPDSDPTRQRDHHSLDLNEGADPDEVTVVPETLLETSQTKDIQKPSGRVANAKKTEAIHRGPPMPEKRQEKSAKKLGKRPDPRSRDNASNLASAKIYDLPQDDDDDVGLGDAAAAEAPPKRGRPGKEPQGKGKTARQSTKRPKASTIHAGQKRGQANRDDSPEDSNDEDYQAGPTRAEDSQGHGGRRSKRLAAARTGGSPEAMEQSPEKDHTDGESEVPGPFGTQRGKPAPVQDAPLTRSHAHASDNLGTKSQLDTHEQRSSSPKHRSSDRSSDAIQLASDNKVRGELDVEIQQNESYDDFEGAVTTMGDGEDIEILESKANKTMTAGPQSGTDSETSKQAKEPDDIQREQMAVVHDLSRELLPPTSASVAPPTMDVIDPALLERIAEQSPRPEQRVVATGVSPALNQEELLKAQTHQTDETHNEAINKANPGSTSQPDPGRPLSTKTTPLITSASQPDPSRSVFARKQPALDQNTRPEPTGTAVAKTVLEHVDASNGEEEIEMKGDSVNEETPPIDENRHRKLTIVGFGKFGPKNQGRTPPETKKPFKDHEGSRPSTTAKATTAYFTRSHLLNSTMRATRTARTTYGSRSSTSFQVAPFEELAQGPDEHHQHHEDKNEESSQVLENSLVETAVEKTSRQKSPSKSDGEDFFAHDFASLPPTKIGPSTPSSIASSPRQVHENPLSATEIGPSTPNIHQRSPSPSGATVMHPGPTPLPTNQAKRSLEKHHQEPIKPLEKEKSLSPGVIRDGLHAEIEPSLASNTGPTARHDHQNPSSPVEATVSHPGSTFLATNLGKQSPEKPVQGIGKPLKKKRSLEPRVSHFTGGLSTRATKQPEAHQSPRKRSLEKPVRDTGEHLKKKRSLEPDVSQFTSGLPAEATKLPEVRQSPRKRTKIENPLSSSYSVATKKLINSMKATTSASPVQVSRRVSPVQRRPARRISNVGSPERRDNGQPGFTTFGDNVHRPQANIDDSPVLTRTRMAPSPASSYGVLSSNRKKVPDAPSASSKAITSHAPEHMLEQSMLLNTPACPEADPFSSPKMSKGESAFMAMMREKTETQGARPTEEPSTPGLEALINARPEDDPDRTLVNDDDSSDDASDTSVASILDDDETEEEEVDEPRERNQHPSEMDWEASLKPHQQNLSFVLSRISERLVRHLIDSETAIEDVVAAFEHDGMELVEKMEQAHQEEYELERGALTKAKRELKSVLELINGKFRKDKKAYENRRDGLNLEAATDSSEKQIGLLEGVLMQLQG